MLTAKRYYFLLTLLCALLYLPGMTTLPVIDRDESHFAQATRQMMQSHNYFATKFLTITRYQKPPGINWLQAASVAMFSSASAKTVWPYRLPSFLGGLLAVLLLFYFARQLIDEKTAFVGSAILASCVLLILEAHMAVIDASLLACVVAMQGALWKIYQNANSKRTSSLTTVLVFWLAMSAGFLLKGVTPLVGLLTVLAICLVDRNLKWLRQLKPLLGVALLLATTALWVIAASYANHGNYLMMVFRADLLPKLQHGVQGHGAPPGTFLLLLSLMFWPGSLFLWMAVRYALKNRRSVNERFLLAWIIPTWLFFALMPTKLPQYVLPTYPAIALLTALGIRHCRWHALGKFFKSLNYLQLSIWSLLTLVIATGMIMLPWFIDKSVSTLSIIAAIVLFVGLLVSVYFYQNKHFHKTLLSISASFIISLWVFAQWVLPNTDDLWLSHKITAAINANAHNLVTAKAPLQVIDFHEPSLAFELGTERSNYTTLAIALNNLKQNKAKLILVDNTILATTINQAKKMQLPLHTIAKIHAYKYSRGRFTTVYLLSSAELTG